MGTVTKTIMFVLTPIFVVMLAAALWYQVYGYARARDAADRQLMSAAELVSQLTLRQVEQVDQAIESIIVQGNLQQYHMYSQVGLLDEAEDSRLWVEQALQRLAEVNPDVERIECYLIDGTRFVAVVDGRRVLTPRNAKDQPWFAATLDNNEYLGFHSESLVRLAETRAPDHSDAPIAVISIVFDFRQAATLATEFATRHLENIHVEIVDETETRRFQHGDAPTAPSSDAMMRQEAPLTRFHSIVRVEQPRATAMADFHRGRNILFTALSVITIGLLVVSALGTSQVVKDLRCANRETARANRELSHHADQLERAHDAIEQQADELAASNKALEASNMELQQFAYLASHDLQTPLRAIAGFSQILQNEYHGKIDDNADEYIDRIVGGTKRMQQLISDLLAYSRVESRSVPFNQTDLNKIYADALSLLQASIEDNDGVVTRDELPLVSGDAAQLSQLLQNLIGNGLKYHGDNPPRVHVSAEQNGTDWKFAVRDNGIGIDEKHHEKIFEIFRRLHSQQDYPGTGIGLAVCRRIVDRHGGQIWVESDEGHGCTFRFTIPKNAVSPETSAGDDQTILNAEG